MKGTEFIEFSAVEKQRSASGQSYIEFLRVPEMSAGLYVLPAGGTDSQKPHKETELYCVIRGRGRMRAGGEDRSVSTGSMILVAPGIEHRFYSIEEELAVLVLFAPVESG